MVRIKLHYLKEQPGCVVCCTSDSKVVAGRQGHHGQNRTAPSIFGAAAQWKMYSGHHINMEYKRVRTEDCYILQAHCICTPRCAVLGKKCTCASFGLCQRPTPTKAPRTNPTIQRSDLASRTAHLTWPSACTPRSVRPAAPTLSMPLCSCKHVVSACSIAPCRQDALRLELSPAIGSEKCPLSLVWRSTVFIAFMRTWACNYGPCTHVIRHICCAHVNRHTSTVHMAHWKYRYLDAWEVFQLDLPAPESCAIVLNQHSVRVPPNHL